MAPGDDDDPEVSTKAQDEIAALESRLRRARQLHRFALAQLRAIRDESYTLSGAENTAGFAIKVLERHGRLL